MQELPKVCARVAGQHYMKNGKEVIWSGKYLKCVHGSKPSRCTKCGDGKSLCKHGTRRRRCVRCKGNGICEHGKRKEKCATCDPTNHLAETMRSRLHSGLKAQNSIKLHSSMDYLGCSFRELRIFIEEQFKPGMTWSKHGNGPGCFHIDHRRPLSNFNLKMESERRKAFHYTNLQPLWAVDNLRKNNRWSDDSAKKGILISGKRHRQLVLTDIFKVVD